MKSKCEAEIKKADNREPARDCKFYKTDNTCVGLNKMICKVKACRFYKSIHKS